MLIINIFSNINKIFHSRAMGNAESNVTSGIKKQTDAGSVAMYSLMDLKGGGELVVMMKEAQKTKDFTHVRAAAVIYHHTEMLNIFVLTFFIF